MENRSLKTAGALPYFVFFLLFLPAFIPLRAQPGLEDQRKSISLRFEDIGPEQGLPHKTVQALLQDKMGFIWMGTPASLAKYDGYEFTSFAYEYFDSSAAEIKQQAINVIAIEEGPDSSLWIGCAFERPEKPVLFHFSRETEKLTPLLYDWENDSSIIQSPVRNIHIGQGYLWANANQLYRISLEALGLGREGFRDLPYHRFELEMPSYLEWKIWSIYEDAAGRIWLPGFEGIYQWMPEGDTLKFHSARLPDLETPPIFWLFDLLPMADGKLLATTFIDGLLLRFDPEDASLEPMRAEGYEWSIQSLLANTNELWLGKDYGSGGLKLLDMETGQVADMDIHAGDKALFPITQVMSLLKDFSGNIWVGAKEGPLLKFNPEKNQFHLLSFEPNTPNTLAPGPVSGLAQDGEGYYWIATLGGGINRWDRRKHTIEQFHAQPGNPDGLYTDFILGLDATENGKIWFGEGKYVGCYDPAAGRYRHYPFGAVVHTLYTDIQNQLWVGYYGALGRYDPARDQFTIFNAPPTMAIAEDSRGGLWLGFSSLGPYDWKQHGVFRFDIQKEKIEPFELPEGNAFCEGPGGHIWIASVNGLYRYDPSAETFQRYGLNDGLPSPVVNAIQQDGQGCLWIATDNGLSRFDPEKEAFRNFYQSDGLPANTFNPVSYKNEKGELFFAGNFGLLYFHPDSIRENAVPPKLAFTGMDLFGEPVSIGEDGPLDKHISLARKVRLSHWQNDFTIHYAALHYKNPAKNRYRIKLDNYDQNWRDVGVQRSAGYTNLDPGRYTFRVKAANSDGAWNDEDIALAIIISPPWYWNWWSKLLYALLFAGAAYSIYRFQINRRLALAEANRLKELDGFKTKLYTNITHEFRTPLTVIQGMAGQIEGHEEEKEAIQRNSRNLLNLVNRMLGLSKIEAGKMELNLVQGDILPFLRYVTESFHSFALSQKVNLNFYSDAEEAVMDYDPEKVREVLSNLLSNALKFTPGYGKIQVVAKVQQEDSQPYLELTVSDTGVGIAPEKLPHIFDRFYQVEAGSTRKAEGTGIGLALARELVELMKGTIEAESQPGAGAKFIVKLPITRNVENVHNKALMGSLDQEYFVEPEAHLNSAVEPEERAATSGTIDQPDNPSKNTILLVEDNRDVMHYLTSCLTSPSFGGGRGEAYQLLYAHNGREGITQALEHMPDIIISDVMMPEVGGFELCQALKKDERTSHIPIILLTARADMDSRLEGLEYGADAYLAKPFQREELEIRLRKLIELRRKLQARYSQPDFRQQPATQKEDAFVLNVKERLLENLDDDTFGIEELSKELGLSRVHLYRKLKALTGKSTSHFIRQVRLQEAYKLLRSGEFNVSEVAYKVGYKDPNFFTRIFSEYYGKPPSEV
ncbi:MAG: response regulator [Lewinellaceae bacterium]|nr:response regulator [Lewinellaceae bacterium]